MKKSLFIISLCSLMTISCGQTGPLVLPVQEQQTNKITNTQLSNEPEAQNSVSESKLSKEKK